MPFKSQAQAGKMWSMADAGEIPKKTVEEWASKTPSIKALPKHVKKDEEHKKVASWCFELGRQIAKSAAYDPPPYYDPRQFKGVGVAGAGAGVLGSLLGSGIGGTAINGILGLSNRCKTVNDAERRQTVNNNVAQNGQEFHPLQAALGFKSTLHPDRPNLPTPKQLVSGAAIAARGVSDGVDASGTFPMYSGEPR